MLLPPDSVLVGVHLEKKAWGLIKWDRGKYYKFAAPPPRTNNRSVPRAPVTEPVTNVFRSRA